MTRSFYTPGKELARAEPSAAAAAAMAADSWSSRAAYPGHGLDRGSAAMAPNAAGQSVVYLLGGTEGEFDVGKPVRAYNVATDTWTTKAYVWRSRAAPARAHEGVVRVTLGGTAHLLAAGGGHGFENDTPNASELYTR